MKRMILLLIGTLLFCSLSAETNSSPIGHWGEDEAGLPCFHYTGALPAVGMKPDGTKAKLPSDPWFLLGNYQLTLFAHVSGEYELITGQRAWGRMNQGDKVNSGKNRSSLLILDGQGQVANSLQLINPKTPLPIGEGQGERLFGCGYARYSYTLPDMEVERTLSVAPSTSIDGGASAFLLTVRIKNKGKEAVTLAYEEAIRANYVPIQFQRQAAGPLTYLYDFLTDSDRKIVRADIRGTSPDPLAVPAEDEMAVHDGYPPSLFVKLLSEGTASCDTAGWLTASAPLTLKRGEEQTLQMVIGYTFDEDNADIERMARELTATPHAEQWLKVLPRLDGEKDQTLRQEMRWHAYNLEAMATYSRFYGETKIPQGTIYDYYWGQHASARDNFQHALPLIYYNPQLAASVLRYMAKRTTPWGEIRLIEYGNGYADNGVYQTSDQQLFFFLLLAEYLRVTHDYALLDQPIDFFPQGSGGRGTMMDICRQCFLYLKNSVGLGPHGLVRLLNSDWNDNVFVAKKVSYNTVIYTGESHMNTTMALSILANLIPSLQAYQGEQKDVASSMAESIKQYRSYLYTCFMNDLADRTFSRRMYFNGESIGDNQMFLEPQSYMLQIPELSTERKQTLYREMQQRVYAGEKLGARQQEKPEFSAPDLEDGSRENGGFWYSLNGPAIVGVASFDKDEAWRLLRQMTFDNYARQFPHYWTSYWSASDNVESSLMGAEEGLPDQSIDYAVIPVYCAHPHAWLLYCYYYLKSL